LLTRDWAGFQVRVNFDKIDLSKLKQGKDRGTQALVGCHCLQYPVSCVPVGEMTAGGK